MAASRYVVGIDLGTTNCALAYIDTTADPADQRPIPLPIPQVVQQGQVEDRLLLPSFLYLPNEGELPAGSLKLSWAPSRDYAVGEFARDHGGLTPTRLVSSAKSWLCHSGVNRRAAILPWRAPEDSRRVSPLEACTYFLRHLAEAWNQTIGKDLAVNRLEVQEIILTVPASFDAVARELTVEAARAAGFENVTLLEEPQAAFYAWIDANGDKWRKQVKVGDAVLICDIGGGTTDLSLIAVEQEGGQLVLSRVAVGDHILLGGDNMDLALAGYAGQVFASKGNKLDAAQQLQLWHSARAAKEKLFTDKGTTRADVTVLGRGRSLFGSTLKTELNRAEVEKILIDGFFPDCPADVEPRRQRTVGLQELGLPYATDPAITKHLAFFLHRHAALLAEQQGRDRSTVRPTAVLFNGGVFKAEPLRERIVEVLNQWNKTEGGGKVRVLKGSDLDLAVARGAAYYGLARRGTGVRIRGGAARSYYIGVETSLPAIPGAEPPIKALCVVPFGMEEGSEADVAGTEFGLVVGEPAQFRFLGSSTRRNDTVGTFVEEWQGEIEELTPMETTLDAGGGARGAVVPIHLLSKMTEIGTLELWCLSRDEQQRWKLEFNVRERPDEEE
jgi:molecular chaperone DnaK (HSP70)